MRSFRVGISRLLALALVTTQVAAYALAPYAEARTSNPPDLVTHVEAADAGVCAPIHRPDSCLACQMMSLRAVTTGTAVFALAAPAAVRVAAVVLGRVPAARDAASSPLQPRAPPVTTA